MDWAAIHRRVPDDILSMSGGRAALPTRFADFHSNKPEAAEVLHRTWRNSSIPGPAMMAELKKSTDTPVRVEERALGVPAHCADAIQHLYRAVPRIEGAILARSEVVDG